MQPTIQSPHLDHRQAEDWRECPPIWQRPDGAGQAEPAPRPFGPFDGDTASFLASRGYRYSTDMFYRVMPSRSTYVRVELWYMSDSQLQRAFGIGATTRHAYAAALRAMRQVRSFGSVSAAIFTRYAHEDIEDEALSHRFELA